MDWRIDEGTLRAAIAHPVYIQAQEPAPQFDGCNFNPESWQQRILPGDWFPGPPHLSSPEAIIDAFVEHQYLTALALVVSWGGMARSAGHIYAEGLEEVNRVLARCDQLIGQTQSIEEAWELLAGLGWSAVIRSKTLHFLCRALGFDQDPPVPIDNAVILANVWPAFRDGILLPERPEPWNGNSFDSYSRYMTAILRWSLERGWTTTQVEATLFHEYR